MAAVALLPWWFVVTPINLDNLSATSGCGLLHLADCVVPLDVQLSTICRSEPWDRTVGLDPIGRLEAPTEDAAKLRGTHASSRYRLSTRRVNCSGAPSNLPRCTQR